ncbi:hypothetical protein [Sphaerisporangium flaviroseum]|uniref:hypothetical protein n=1 Tax=Sphaerisporangium flaviroseum TaxID=509199 RepID=UPI003CD0903E
MLAWTTKRLTTADVADNLLLLIEAEHTLRPHRDARKALGFGDDDDQPPAPEWEREMLLLAASLQDSVQEILATLNGRSLTLTSERDQAGDLYRTLVYLRGAIDLLPKDEHNPPGPLSLRDLQRRQDRALNKQLITRTRRRDELAQRQQDPDMSPARWRIVRYEPNGYFQAGLDDGHGPLGPRYGGGHRCAKPSPACCAPGAFPPIVPSKSSGNVRPHRIQANCCPTAAGCPSTAATTPTTTTAPTTRSASCGITTSTSTGPGSPPTYARYSTTGPAS